MIIKRFLEDTKFDTNPNILGLIAYGSYVIGTNTQNSDFDFFAITSESKDYRMKRIIEGCLVECNVFSIESLDFLIEEKYSNNETYFESVLKKWCCCKKFKWYNRVA